MRESRSGGEPHGHEAVDLLAPRNTPVRAVEDGTIAKLFVSKAGGNTIYQFDPSEQFCYYYAHLDHYANGLHDGQPVAKGEVIGYVGTSGNAPPNTPHLHFAIFKLGDDKRWWHGTAIDPYLVLSALKRPYRIRPNANKSWSLLTRPWRRSPISEAAGSRSHPLPP